MELMKGAHYLVLKNAEKLDEKQTTNITPTSGRKCQPQFVIHNEGTASGTLELAVGCPNARRIGKMVSDSKSIEHAPPKKVCKVTQKALSGHL
jgi:hypothetical protein